MTETIAEIEALLMASKGLSINDLIKLTGRKRNEILEALDELEEEYSRDHHGVELKNVAERYSFFTKAKHAETVSRIRKRSVTEMTSSQMEVLAIIAYNQPLSMRQIVEFRGSAPSGQIKELLSMELIRRKRDKSKKGNPYVYVTTESFLRLMGIPDLSQLKNTGVGFENTEVSENVRDSLPPEG